MSLSSSILGSKELHKLGSPLVGTLVATGLWGVAFASTALYYQRFPKDRLPFQLLVGLVAFIDFLHTAFLIAATYHRFVDNFGDALASLKLDWREAALLPLLSVIALCVQGFFAWRCYAMMERRVILPIIIGVACLFTLAFSGVYTQRNHDPQNFIKNTLDRPDGYFMTAVSLPAASDALIVASMCWVAWKNRDAFSATRIVFSKWLQLAFETNAITFTLCLATAIAYGVKKPYYGAPFSFICAKLYDLTLTMALHARADLKTENLGTRTAVTTRTQNSSTDRSYGKGLPQVHPMHLVTVRNDEAITSDKESIKETV